MKKAFFFIGLFFIFLFYWWSSLTIVSLLLFIVVDSFTIKYITNNTTNLLPHKLGLIIRYIYLLSIPIMFAIFFRTFFFDIYFVPSSSMENTLFPNDYVIINKIRYGVKFPNHFRNVPIIGRFFPRPNNEYNLYQSLRPFKKLQREDIIVFKAVDDSDKFLIKRVIGMPSDTIQIKKNKVFINSKQLLEKENYSYNYTYKQSDQFYLIKNFSNKEFLEASEAQKKKYRKDYKEKPNYKYSIFPYIQQEKWTIDNYGKLTIPKKGMKIKLTEQNINYYKNIVLKFENINLKKITEHLFYTFKNDYYFVMGDNRDNSIDSRSFGFVPESYIQGKMICVFSKSRLFN